MSQRPRRIVIVGGGVAGLTLACALDSRRFSVALVEAQPERATGAALGLWSSARRVLVELGVDLPQSAPDRWISIHHLGGRRVATLPAPPVAQVKRPELMSALVQALPPSVERITATVDDPASLDADLVIGADGVRSRVRALVDPRAATRREMPWVTLRGLTAPTRTDHAVPCGREFWGRERLFGDAPVAGGRYWFTAHRSDLGPEPLDPSLVLAEAHARFAEAAPVVRDTLATADSEVLATRLWVTPPMLRYRRGRYVVIGDAAHASAPNLARGATDAILDAVTLARVLNDGGSSHRWEARRVMATQSTRLTAGAVLRVATGRLLP